MSTTPLIAVSGYLKVGESPSLSLRTRYVTPLLEAGAAVVVIPPAGGLDHLAALLQRVDGLLLTGGDDFDTQRLGLEPTHPAAVVTPPGKQDQDMALAQLALDQDLPVLGVCYGMQLLGLAGGASLLQHLPEDRPGCQEHRHGTVHTVDVTPESKLAGALGVEGEGIPVVSRHHQALDNVQEPWRIVARDSEGLVEAIEHPQRTFVVGVQWHPELAPAPSPQAGLFAALVAAARLHAPTNPLLAKQS